MSRGKLIKLIHQQAEQLYKDTDLGPALMFANLVRFNE